MNRASPVELRKAIEAAQAFVKAGVLFVPIPVMDEQDYVDLQFKLHARMDKMIADAEEVKS